MFDNVGWDAISGRAIEMFLVYFVGIGIMLVSDIKHKQA